MAAPKSPLLQWFRPAAPAHAVSSHRIILEGAHVDYLLKRSPRRRSITLTIDENGLRVGAPWRASQSRIEALLLSHARWITRKLAEWQSRRPPPFTWQAGATVMALGEPLTLAIDTGSRITARYDGELRVGAGTDDPDILGRHVVAWLRDTAQDWFERRAIHFAQVLDVRTPSILLSNARTRWGTCHPDGRVHLNWRLIQAPAHLIDYVVVHELAHLREPNHSPRFWNWVACVLPDYKERRLSLRRDCHRYLLA